MKLFLIYLLLVIVPAGVFAQKDKAMVLIVDGFSNHDWKQTTAVTKWILEESGRFVVDVSTIPMNTLDRSLWNPDFEKYALVIQNTNNIMDPSIRWPKRAEKRLEQYLKNGGGLYVLHSANNAFSDWKAYNKMIGLGWRKASEGYALEVNAENGLKRIRPGEGDETGHGNRFNVLVEVLSAHPINKGYPTRWRTVDSEVYAFARGPAKNISILSFAFDSTWTQKKWPLEWIVKYGKGRVYNSSLGHLWKGDVYPPAYRCIGYQTTLIRAAEWLATGRVSFPIPFNFPTALKQSLRPEASFKGF